MSALNMPPDTRTIELIARELAIDEAFIEKDWHGVQVIAALTSLAYPDYTLIFSGGTALSKAHKLIQRFSEDIDFRLHPLNHIPNRAALSELRKRLIEALCTQGFMIDDSSIESRDGNSYFSFMVRYAKQFSHSALRPDIQVEVKLDIPKLPVLTLPVSSFVASFMKQPPEAPAVACLDYVENAADKLSAAAWRIPARVRGSEHDDPAVVRHLHDLAILKEAVIRHPQFATLVEAAMQADTARSRDASFIALTTQEKFTCMFTILMEDAFYPDEYRRFLAGLSYASQESVPDFRAAIKAVQELAQNIA